MNKNNKTSTRGNKTMKSVSAKKIDSGKKNKTVKGLVKKRGVKAKKAKLSISFIIPRRITESSEENLQLIHTYAKGLGLDYEVIVSKGNSATAQRNHSADLAGNEYLYFLDNDSLLQKETLVSVKSFIEQKVSQGEGVDILGGPSLLQEPAPLLQKAIDATLSCRAVVGEVAARYASLGKPRLCNEKSLILCNMLVRRTMFYEIKKFYEMLYPAEEVDFIMRANRLGKKAYYHPGVVIRRPQRTTFGKYAFQMFNYGVGRAEMTKLVPLNFNFFFLLPGFAVGFGLLMLLVLGIFVPFFLVKILLVLGGAYGIYLLFIVGKVIRVRMATLLVPFTVFTCHSCYGVGIFWGFIKRKYAANLRKQNMHIEKIGSK